MATQGLFGPNMGDEEMSRQLLEQRAMQFAQMPQSQRLASMGYKAGSQLGSSIAGLFGVDTTDPLVKRARRLEQLRSQVDTTTPEGLRQLATLLQQEDPETALKAVQMAQQMELQGAKIRGEEAKATRAQQEVEREDNLRNALATLPEGATDKDIRKALMKFGSADKLLTVLTSEADRAAQREQQLTLARERIDAQIQMARERGATQETIARMQIEGRQQLATLVQALKSEKPVEVDDKSATRIGQNIIFDKLAVDGTNLLDTIDKNKKAFTLPGRAEAAVKSVAKPDDPMVKARSDVDAYLNKARNAYLLAAKGTQTEGDAQRAWTEFANSLDFSSAEGAKRSVERIREELLTQKRANEAYLRSRRIPVQGGNPETKQRTVVRTGTYQGRKVVEYSDGSVEYAN